MRMCLADYGWTPMQIHCCHPLEPCRIQRISHRPWQLPTRGYGRLSARLSLSPVRALPVTRVY